MPGLRHNRRSGFFVFIYFLKADEILKLKIKEMEEMKEVTGYPIGSLGILKIKGKSKFLYNPVKNTGKEDYEFKMRMRQFFNRCGFKVTHRRHF